MCVCVAYTSVGDGQAAKEFSLPCSCDFGNSFAVHIGEQNNRTDIQTEQICGGYLDSSQVERDSNTTQNANETHCLSE